MPHKLYYLHKRPTTKTRKYIYYVQFYDEYGNRLPAKSTGQMTKSAAESWCQVQLKKGMIPSQKRVSFEKWVEDWWVYDKCEYVQSRLARGRNLSRRYIDGMRGLLDNHILTLEETRLLFQDSSLEEVWGGDLRLLTANILSLTTGMRQGEILALQNQYVYSDHVVVMWNWSKQYGMVEPKWQSQREVPIPTKTLYYLDELRAMSPFQEHYLQ